MNTSPTAINLGFKQIDSPFRDILVDKDGVVCFASTPKPNDCVVSSIKSVEWGSCAYGASDCKIYPFYTPITGNSKKLLASDILKYIKAASFKSDHIIELNCESINFPGYHPDTNNDEIHTDDTEQYIFAKEEDSNDNPTSFENHKYLKRQVIDEKLWYILLHSKKHKHGEYEFCDYVCLLALGKSLVNDSLIGVVTYQVCHNLCD